MRTGTGASGPGTVRSSTLATGSPGPRVTAAICSMAWRAWGAVIFSNSSTIPADCIASIRALVCGSSGIDFHLVGCGRARCTPRVLRGLFDRAHHAPASIEHDYRANHLAGFHRAERLVDIRQRALARHHVVEVKPPLPVILQELRCVEAKAARPHKAA